ncbi:hypothetical protein LJR010_004533 [Ensifer adhaerens]
MFYWATRGLNRWADEVDGETITKESNGGKNGPADRFDAGRGSRSFSQL